jgi:hypothetical protein
MYSFTEGNVPFDPQVFDILVALDLSPLVRDNIRSLVFSEQLVSALNIPSALNMLHDFFTQFISEAMDTVSAKAREALLHWKASSKEKLVSYN